jgi:hypothetical protein
LRRFRLPVSAVRGRALFTIHIESGTLKMSFDVHQVIMRNWARLISEAAKQNSSAVRVTVTTPQGAIAAQFLVSALGAVQHLLPGEVIATWCIPPGPA